MKCLSPLDNDFISNPFGMAIVPLRGFHKSTTNKMTHILMAKRLTLCLNVKYVQHISEIHIYDLTYL